MKVSMKKGITLNLGNYESIRLDVGIEMDVEEGDFNKSIDSLDEQVTSELESQAKRYKKDIEIF
jgi:hypothetical protein